MRTDHCGKNQNNKTKLIVQIFFFYLRTKYSAQPFLGWFAQTQVPLQQGRWTFYLGQQIALMLEMRYLMQAVEVTSRSQWNVDHNNHKTNDRQEATKDLKGKMDFEPPQLAKFNS